MGGPAQRCMYRVFPLALFRLMSCGEQNAIFDFGFRALHMSVVAGKEVVKQYYGTATRKSYYLGCSTGMYVFNSGTAYTYPDTRSEYRWSPGVSHISFLLKFLLKLQHRLCKPA